jgi:transposase InsO family protein
MVSMSQRGNPYDNAVMERFFKTLKYEEVSRLHRDETIEDVMDRLPCFIKEVYKRRSIIRRGLIRPSVTVRRMSSSSPDVIGIQQNVDVPRQTILTPSAQS